MAIHIIDEHNENCLCDIFNRDVRSDIFYTGNEFLVVLFNECICYNRYDYFIDICDKLDKRFKYTDDYVDRITDVDRLLLEYRKSSEVFNKKMIIINYQCESSNNYKKILYSKIDFNTFLLTSLNVKEHFNSLFREVNSFELFNNIPCLKNSILEKAKKLYLSNYIHVSDKQISITTDFLIKKINQNIKTK